jgi:hypothetical protein
MTAKPRRLSLHAEQQRESLFSATLLLCVRPLFQNVFNDEAPSLSRERRGFALTSFDGRQTAASSASAGAPARKRMARSTYSACR